MVLAARTISAADEAESASTALDLAIAAVRALVKPAGEREPSSLSMAVKLISKERGVSKKELYRASLELGLADELVPSEGSGGG